MATTIKIKSTTTAGKVPTDSDIQIAELAINLADKKLFSRNAAGVFAIKTSPNVPGGTTPPSTDNVAGDLFFDETNDQLLYWDGTAWVPINTELALGDLTNVAVAGVTDGQLLSYDNTSSSWVPVDSSTLSVSVNLGYSASAGGGTVTNSAGSDASLPLANGSSAGLSLNNFSATDKSTLGTALQSVSLGYSASSSGGTVTNSAGANASIPQANGSNAGLSLNDLTSGRLSTLNSALQSGDVDLSWSSNSSSGTVSCSAGNNATISLGNGSNAGLSINNYSTTEKNKLAGYPSSPSGLAADTLQAVTDAGSSTSRGISLGSGNISLNSDGTSSFASTLTIGGGNATISSSGTVTANGYSLSQLSEL